MSCLAWGYSSVVDRRQETRTCMVQACHTPRQPLRKTPSGHLVKRRELAWFRHVTRHDSLSETLRRGTLSRDENLHGSGMSNATTASLKPSFGAPCQETRTCMVQACHTPRRPLRNPPSGHLVKRRELAWFGHVTSHNQPLRNPPSGHLGGWAAPWSAEEMLNRQHQRVDVPAHARTAHKGLLQKRLEEDLC